MTQPGDRNVVAAGGQANEAPAQPVAQNVAAAAAVQANGAAPAAPAAVPGNPDFGIGIVGVPQRFDVVAVMLLPLPTKSNFKDYEIYPRVDLRAAMRFREWVELYRLRANFYSISVVLLLVVLVSM